MTFELLGKAAAAWIAAGLVTGIAYVGTRPALFFSAGFLWGSMLLTVLSIVPQWPLAAWVILRGERREEEAADQERRRRSRDAARSYRAQLRDGKWYLDVLGTHRKLMADASGRNWDPNEVGRDVDRIREEDFPCRNGEWTSGKCPLCGAPDRANSACGMVRTEFAGVPQYDPPARLMRHAPAQGFVLAVSNPGDGDFLDRDADRFHQVTFRATAPGRGVWVDRDGNAVDGLYGWWTLPRMRECQVSDAMEEPHRWLGDVPPEAYDYHKAWDAFMDRPSSRADVADKPEAA